MAENKEVIAKGLVAILASMSDAVKFIANAGEQLGRNDLAVFREWFSTFDAAERDAQIEVDR
ncbi:MAG: hypothetical protein JHD00_13315 [Akkermansiaceae bacterium]|nr:hypothetical protein [Akkermansiaceae bacterium]